MRHIICAALAITYCAPAVAGTIVLSDGNGTSATIYDNRDEWLAALGAGDLRHEDFEDTALAPGLQVMGSGHEFDGTLHQTLRNSSNYLSIFLLAGAKAIGFDYELVPSAGAEGLSLTMNFDNSDIFTSITSPTGFYGVVGSKALAALTFEARRFRTQEYRLDNFDFRSAVPEPMTWAMLLFGFGTVGVAIRGRRALAHV